MTLKVKFLSAQDLRDRLWDICDARKEEAEQERLDIINNSWLQDSVGIMLNNFFSLMQVRAPVRMTQTPPSTATFLRFM